MKKFYSLVLMAAALLIGTNAWAQISVVYHNGTTPAASFSDLQEAINSVAAGDSATMTLSDDLELSAGVLIPQLSAADNVDGKRIADRAPQRICINLNGHNITTLSSTDHCAFALMKGVLRFDGQGIVERYNQAKGNSNWKRGTILVSGTDGNKNDASADRSKQEWSVLYIGKDVTIYSGGFDTYGIGIQDLGASKPDWGGFNMDYAGYKTYYPATDSHMYSPDGSSAQYSAFGVKLMIDGTVYGDVRGINVLGNINQTPGKWDGATGRSKSAYPYYNHNFPYICVGATANVSCRPANIDDNGNGGIYLGGWAVVDVHGTVHGQTGIMAKAGDVKLIDGTVYSDCSTAANGGNYHATVAGSGIFVVSSNAYAGESSIEVTGDSYVAGAGGSAIIDVCATNPNEQTNTAVTHVAITGGTIEAGDQGAISLGTATSNVTDITGGNVSGVIDIGDASDESQRFHTDVTELLPQNEDYHTTEVTVTDPEDPTKTKTIVVISEGPAPTDAESIEDDPTASVKLTKNDTIESGEVVIAELEMNTDTLLIKDGATLNVGRVVLNESAQIIVEAGAKLIVSGKQGIVAPVASNIVLKNEEGKRSIFLFNPAVTSNRHPNATFDILSYSWRASSTEAQSEVFAIPTHNAVKSVECLNAGKYGYIQVYGSNGTWENIGFTDDVPFPYAKLNKPFAAYALIAYRGQNEDPLSFRFGGELVGNDNATLTSNMTWSFFANSYTAEVDLDKFLDGLGVSAQSVIPYIYIARVNGNGHWYWEAIGAEELDDDDENLLPTKLQPMQGFLLFNKLKQVESNAINYKNMVYDPAIAEIEAAKNGAPARRVAANNNTAKMYVAVTSEAGVYDNVKLRETENAKYAEKYMNDDVNIYVTAEEKSAIFATEDLENTYVGFSTVKGGKFTISFANVDGKEFTLVDHETGARVEIAKGNTYEFTAGENTVNDYRFEIVGRANMPTAIENTEAVKSAKGIYTITGQYMGEVNVWNALPAGVYVVNGEKRVK